MSINDIIAEYLNADSDEKAAKKRKAAAKTMIKEYFNGKESFTTDKYNAILKKKVSIRLNTDELYNDFPDIKKDYGKETVSEELIIAMIEQSAGKTA